MNIRPLATLLVITTVLTTILPVNIVKAHDAAIVVLEPGHDHRGAFGTKQDVMIQISASTTLSIGEGASIPLAVNVTAHLKGEPAWYIRYSGLASYLVYPVEYEYKGFLMYRGDLLTLGFGDNVYTQYVDTYIPGSIRGYKVPVMDTFYQRFVRTDDGYELHGKRYYKVVADKVLCPDETVAEFNLTIDAFARFTTYFPP